MLSRARITIYGVVQGVGFRYFTLRIARKLGLVGYVQNLTNGSVEIMVEGEKRTILKLIEEVRIGPPGASVENLKITWETPKGDYKDFLILR
ncbi:MAG: acylphosphatase [Candidatus Methanomethylicia archaeon]|uniref:Acylphosphatase n=1 Tax=Thermoproteota archaeon TaxID=2056631 RepID=A0A523BCR4_9CREN|nr:acylphosphatase [Candidatus Methanomethylicia archaeon]MCQ5374398.1 acylphosphatase [Candidatus Methanomethylicia archaeon]NHV60393.1 acylphosphatase [Candidatus Verstraetearchaeota archaeon]TDA38652.1 MAG: acylphosphatase [Candidatus Verstraetearchaeota archaeon]